jgi:hypothetical protein
MLFSFQWWNGTILLMQILRKMGLLLCILLFVPLLLMAVSSYAFNKTVGNQAYVQQTLHEAKFYHSVSEAIVAAARGAEAEESLVTESLHEAFSAETIEGAVNPVIDSVYDWLAGEVEHPVFAIDLLPARTAFEQSFKQKLETRAASLPTCTTAVELTVVDIAEAQCIPPNTDVNALIDDAVARVVNTADVFTDEAIADGKIEVDEVKELNIQAPQPEDLPQWPVQAYQFTQQGVWYFAIGALITGLGVVFLSERKLSGLRNLSILLLINGILLAVLSSGAGVAGDRFAPTASVDATEAPVRALQEAAHIITDANSTIGRNFGIGFAIAGLVGTIATSVVLSRSKKSKLPPPAAPIEIPTPPKVVR